MSDDITTACCTIPDRTEDDPLAAYLQALEQRLLARVQALECRLRELEERQRRAGHDPR